MPDPVRSPRAVATASTPRTPPATPAIVHWPIVALATVPCLVFVGFMIALLAMAAKPKPSVGRSAPPPVAGVPAPVEPPPDALATAEITIPAHHALAAISDLPVFDMPERPPPAAEPLIVPVAPQNDIVPVVPVKEKEKDGCFGTAVNFLASPAEAFTAARKEKRLTLILHVSGNFEDSGFT